MIPIPQVTEEQKAEIKEVKTMPGWKHIMEPIVIAIDLKEKALVNWVFERDTDDQITRRSVGRYEKTQIELVLLKEFRAFIQEGGVIFEEEDMEVFEDTSK